MRVPLAWLRSYCDPGLSAQEIADALTMAGDKVERLHRVGVGDPSEFVVGRVLESDKHPDADRLTVCLVDVGNAAPQTIVCGAPNVAAGQTVAVALPGAIMPDGTKLGEAKLRGVKSSGMILAEDELGIGEDHDGIMVLSDELPPALRWPSTCRSPTTWSSSRSPPTGRTPWRSTASRATCTPSPPRPSRRIRPTRTPSRAAPTRPPTTSRSRSTQRSAFASPRACSKT